MKQTASLESTVPYPFNVTLIIHSAEKLAVADITSSDPYVIILLDNKEIGVNMIKLISLPCYHYYDVIIITIIIIILSSPSLILCYSLISTRGRPLFIEI
jgi:hypothetical protein